MKVVQVSAENRTELGKKATSNLRKEGKIPAVVYSVNGVVHFSTSKKAVKSLVYTPDLKIAEINIEGQLKRALVKEIDFHPVTDEIVHMDFIELVPNQKVFASVPVKFKGVSPGVIAGGKLMKGLRTVKVKATPETLVDELFIDISSLELSQAVRVNDIEVPEGITIEVGENTPIAVVEVPRALKKDDEIEAEVEEAVVEE